MRSSLFHFCNNFCLRRAVCGHALFEISYMFLGLQCICNILRWQLFEASFEIQCAGKAPPSPTSRRMLLALLPDFLLQNFAFTAIPWQLLFYHRVEMVNPHFVACYDMTEEFCVMLILCEYFWQQTCVIFKSLQRIFYTTSCNISSNATTWCCVSVRSLLSNARDSIFCNVGRDHRWL